MEFLQTYATELLYGIFILCSIVALAILRAAYVRTGPQQSSEELLDRARKVKDMQEQIAAEGRANIRGIRRVM